VTLASYFHKNSMYNYMGILMVNHETCGNIFQFMIISFD
jgi:hypothetical protein